MQVVRGPDLAGLIDIMLVCSSWTARFSLKFVILSQIHILCNVPWPQTSFLTWTSMLQSRHPPVCISAHTYFQNQKAQGILTVMDSSHPVSRSLIIERVAVFCSLLLFFIFYSVSIYQLLLLSLASINMYLAFHVCYNSELKSILKIPSCAFCCSDELLPMLRRACFTYI